MLAQGLYVAPRGAVNLSIPLAREYLERLIDAVAGYLRRFRHLLAATTPT